MTARWRDSSFVPPRSLVTQAGGICFTDDELVVLVTADGESWGLPGGHLETGETMENAFIREVKEEACAMVTSFVYLGAQEVSDPQNPNGLTTYYQTCFWSRVQLNEFKPEHEITGRKLVKPSEVNLSLRWDPGRILKVILQAALDCERRFKEGG